MQITILAPGSRGDVQPSIALGQGLRSLGHQASLVTTLDHEALVRSYGLSVATIPVNVAEELQRVETTRAVEGGGVIASFRQFTAIAKRSSRALAEVGLEACRGADVLVTNFTTALLADALSKKTGVPLVQAYNVPVTPNGDFPGALFPGLDFGGLSRRLGHHLTRAALWATARGSAREACVEVLGAKAPSMLPGSHAGLLPGPLLYGFSEAFLSRPTEWPADVELTGFWFVEEPDSFRPPEDLAAFLDDGPPPVCVGFGSMSTEKPAQVGALVLEAAEAAKVRLVLLAGWAGLKPGRLSKDVIALGAVPHTWLYPRCAAVVHHGGAGTTAAGVRAGVPAVVVPFHGDQPFWASRVHRLGVGPRPVPRRALTAASLAAALATATTDASMRERAAVLGRRVREEHGARRAADRIVQAGSSAASTRATS